MPRPGVPELSLLIGALIVVAIVWFVVGTVRSRKRCAYCDETIRKGAKVCKHCQREQPAR